MTAHRFDWSTGYASQRSPLFARNVVSTSHPLAAQAGLRMMQPAAMPSTPPSPPRR
jgi:gamma-glutamyltranspeptidase/glutathione hydrolase